MQQTKESFVWREGPGGPQGNGAGTGIISLWTEKAAAIQKPNEMQKTDKFLSNKTTRK